MNKYIMVDMDGVLCSYNIHDSVILEDWFEPNIFANLLPVSAVIERLFELKTAGYKLFVLSASPSNLANKEKYNWLTRFVPFISDIYFVGETKRKIDMLERICLDNDMIADNVYVLDDTHSVLVEAEERGFHAIHPSRLLAKRGDLI